jgi:HlyD family secretion protein
MEATLKSSIQSDKLQQIQRSRSGKPPDVKELEANLAERALQSERVKLELAKTTLKYHLAQHEIDLATFTAQRDLTRRTREQSLVRSPLEGVVVQIFSRQGERVSLAGIAKVVDKAKITLRAAPTLHKGTILRVAPTVKRMERVEPDGGSSTDARIVQVEIQFDDLSSAPQATDHVFLEVCDPYCPRQYWPQLWR